MKVLLALMWIVIILLIMFTRSTPPNMLFSFILVMIGALISRNFFRRGI